MPDERREKLPEVWTIYVCPQCGGWQRWPKGICSCVGAIEQVEVVPRSLSGLASILQGLDEEELAGRLAWQIAMASLPEFSATWAVDPGADEWAELASVALAALSEMGAPKP